MACVLVTLQLGSMGLPWRLQQVQKAELQAGTLCPRKGSATRAALAGGLPQSVPIPTHEPLPGTGPGCPRERPADSILQGGHTRGSFDYAMSSTETPEVTFSAAWPVLWREVPPDPEGPPQLCSRRAAKTVLCPGLCEGVGGNLPPPCFLR